MKKFLFFSFLVLCLIGLNFANNDAEAGCGCCGGKGKMHRFSNPE